MPHRTGGKEATKHQRAWQAANLPAHAAAQARYEQRNTELCRRRKREAWRQRKYGSKTLPSWAKDVVGNIGKKMFGGK